MLNVKLVHTNKGLNTFIVIIFLVGIIFKKSVLKWRHKSLTYQPNGSLDLVIISGAKLNEIMSRR